MGYDIMIRFLWRYTPVRRTGAFFRLPWNSTWDTQYQC